MACNICGRSSCARWMHSLAAQEEYDKLQADRERAIEYLNKYIERGLPDHESTNQEG